MSNPQDRPKMTIPQTWVERGLNWISLIVLVGSLIYLAVEWAGLPSRIVTHFDGSGEPDGWGGKGTLFILPVISLLVYSGLTALSKYPHAYNYPVPITESNAAVQYLNARRLIEWMKFEIILIFGYIQWAGVRVAKEQASGLGIWFLPAILAVVVGTVAYYLVRAFRAGRS